ncbi:MAG TPA: riboflavin synthase [Candidatus Saccharicenans sp.]|nr:riboflavin synthase [Candidatus Saccharicenans sp.]
MFTGLVGYQGKFIGLRKNRTELVLEVPEELAARLEPGQSLAVDGVCLTVSRKEKNQLFFTLSRESLDRTNLKDYRPGKNVNLELPLRLNDFLGGHLVTGHIDGTGQVQEVKSRPPGKRLKIKVPTASRKYLVDKGSVAVNGVSLTVATLGPDWLEVELIPATLQATNLNELRPGDRVNLEGDIIGKYVYNFLSKKF